MSFPKVPGWSTVSNENSKCRSVYTAMPDITHSPFHFGGGFGSELQKSILLMKDPVYGLSGYDPSMWLWHGSVPQSTLNLLCSFKED